MADLVTQDLSGEGGAEVSFVAADAGGDKFVWTASTFLMIKNDDASPKTVTLDAVQTSVTLQQYGELTRADIVLVVGAGEVAVIPPPPTPFRNDSDAGKVAVTYSAVTSLLVAAAQM